LADSIREAEGRPPTIVDIAGVERLEVSEARAVATFIQNVVGLRGIEGSQTITLRLGDLEVLATSIGERFDHFAEKLQPALRGTTEDD
jgi:hypothetical protein